jgi:nicotinamidase-related amidase
MPRTALFVIDIQVGIAQDPATEIRCAQRVRDAGTEVLARGRAAIAEARTHSQHADLKIVVVQHEETPESGTLLKGSRAWEVVFKPRGDEHGERLVSKNVRE